MTEIDEQLGEGEEIKARLAQNTRRRAPLSIAAPATPVEARGAPGESMSASQFFDGEPSWLEYGERMLALLDELVERLRRAQARAPDSTPTQIHTIGPHASRRPEVLVPRLASGASAGDVVRRAIAASVVRLIQHDTMMRLDTDPEGVHQARVATRRLRSDMRTFRSLLDREWASALRDELGWLAQALGVVRDSDVMLERMRTRAVQLSEVNARDTAPVLATLEAAGAEARAGLFETLGGDRYLALLDHLAAAANAPVLLLEADLPAPAVLPRLVRRPWRRLARLVNGLGDSPADDELHAVRIEAKRVRYAAEAVAPLLGRQARAFGRAAAALQEVLGELNDAVVAERWLRDWAGRSSSAPAAFAAGELAGLERAAAQRARARWRKAWKELSSPRLRSWM
jgi:CHAD domain-containing protein